VPQPAANDAAARRLIALYEESYATLLGQWTDAAAEPARVRQTARLRELLDSHEAEMARLSEASRTWWATEVPILHAAGAQSAATVTGSRFVWSQPHREALEQFVARTWDDVAVNLRAIDRDTRLALRGEIRSATRAALLESRTAVAAGRDVAREAARAGLWSVEYANGARHTMRDYADTVVRTTTAEAYNRGSVVQTAADGFTHVEYFDGEGCGVVSHDDPTKANGLIVPITDVVYLSHPRCRRAIVPALPTGPLVEEPPDIGDARGPEPAVVPLRSPREPRTPRTPR
jgi:hypothetical protein